MNQTRVYLFDIDGTLLSTGGAGSSAMRGAFEALWHREDAFAGIEFSGRTDRAILREALTAAGCSDRPFEDEVRRFKRAYFHRLDGTLQATRGQVLDGVEGFLQSLADDPDAIVGLATGNFRVSAGMKLAHYRLRGYFCLGGFGDRADDRLAMVEQALKAAGRVRRFSTAFIIGDTVHDITSAKAHGAVAVGVTTGSASADELSRAGADVVLPSLRDAPRQLLPG